MRGTIRAFGRMARAVAARRYRRIPWRTAVGLVVGIGYLVFPLDLIPDPIFALGLLDDAVVLGFVLRAIKKDVDAFRAWESAPSG